MGKIRVSCACLAQIEIDGRYLLIQNKKMRKNGEIVYSPIGGGLEFLPESYDYLIGLGIEFEKGKDLRFQIPEENYTLFTNWFESNTGREKSIFREMKEEMVDEENFINQLLESDFTEEKLALNYTTHDWLVDGEMKTSYYIFEIYRVDFKEDKLNEIKNNLLINDKLMLFSSYELQFNSESNISGHSKYIL